MIKPKQGNSVINSIDYVYIYIYIYKRNEHVIQALINEKKKSQSVIQSTFINLFIYSKNQLSVMVYN